MVAPSRGLSTGCRSQQRTASRNERPTYVVVGAGSAGSVVANRCAITLPLHHNHSFRNSVSHHEVPCTPMRVPCADQGRLSAEANCLHQHAELRHNKHSVATSLRCLSNPPQWHKAAPPRPRIPQLMYSYSVQAHTFPHIAGARTHTHTHTQHTHIHTQHTHGTLPVCLCPQAFSQPKQQGIASRGWWEGQLHLDVSAIA